jgi:hypothetical protein
LKSFQSLCDEMLVFVFYEDGEPHAIFPLYRNEGQVRFIGDGCSHHQDIIARDAASAKWAWRVVMGFIRSEGYSMVIPKVAAHSHLAQVIVASASDTPLLLRQQRVGFSPCLRVSPGANGVGQSVIASPPGVTVRFREGRGIMDGLVEEAAALHCGGQRAHGDISLFENDVFQRFVRAVARREDAGSQLGTLEIEGRVIAFVLGFARGGIFYVYASGIDGRYRDQVPDRFLWGELVRRLREQGEVTLIDVSCCEEAAGAMEVEAEYELLSFVLRQRTAMNRLIARATGFLPPSARADGLARENAGLYETAGPR